MKKNLKLTIIELIIMILILAISGVSNATENVTQKEIKNIIQSSSLNANDISPADVLAAYDEISKQYSNDEIADMLEENKEEIIRTTSVDKATIEAGTKILKTTDEEELRDIIKNDLDIEEIQAKIEAGYSPEQAISQALTPQKVANIGIKLFLANEIVKSSFKVLSVEGLLLLIIRWVIFKKAGRHGWAILIPIYRNVTYLKVCKLSPWWLLLVLVPIIGWLILGIVLIVSRFKLSKAFGRGFFFGLGLLIFRPIFELILAVSNKPYVKTNK